MKSFINKLFVLTFLAVGLIYAFGSYYEGDKDYTTKTAKTIIQLNKSELEQSAEKVVTPAEVVSPEVAEIPEELLEVIPQEEVAPEIITEEIAPATKNGIHIIITDVRNNNIDEILENFAEFKDLGLAFNYDNGEAMEKAKDAGFDNLIATITMEPFNEKIELPAEAITTYNSAEQNVQNLTEVLNKAYMPVAIINEMGSKVTSEKYSETLNAIMPVLSEKGLTFIDSKSNFYSVACEVAEENLVPCESNYLFINSRENMGDAFAELKAEAERNGSVIGIFTYDKNKAEELKQSLQELEG